MKYTESQTIAVERLLPVGAPHWLDAGRYAKVMTGALRLTKKIPGVK